MSLNNRVTLLHVKGLGWVSGWGDTLRGVGWESCLFNFVVFEICWSQTSSVAKTNLEDLKN